MDRESDVLMDVVTWSWGCEIMWLVGCVAVMWGPPESPLRHLGEWACSLAHRTPTPGKSGSLSISCLARCEYTPTVRWDMCHEPSH